MTHYDEYSCTSRRRRRGQGEPMKFTGYLSCGFILLFMILLFLLGLEGFIDFGFAVVIQLLIIPFLCFLPFVIANIEQKRDRKRGMTWTQRCLCGLIGILMFLVFIAGTFEALFDYHFIIPIWMTIFAMACLATLLFPSSKRKDDDEQGRTLDPGIFAED